MATLFPKQSTHLMIAEGCTWLAGTGLASKAVSPPVVEPLSGWCMAEEAKSFEVKSSLGTIPIFLSYATHFCLKSTFFIHVAFLLLVFIVTVLDVICDNDNEDYMNMLMIRTVTMMMMTMPKGWWGQSWASVCLLWADDVSQAEQEVGLRQLALHVLHVTMMKMAKGRLFEGMLCSVIW